MVFLVGDIGEMKSPLSFWNLLLRNLKRDSVNYANDGGLIAALIALVYYEIQALLRYLLPEGSTTRLLRETTCDPS